MHFVRESSVYQTALGGHPLLKSWAPLSILVLLLAASAGLVAYFCFQPSTELFAGLNPYLVTMTCQLWGQMPIDNRKMIFAHKIFLACLLGAMILLSFIQVHWRAGLEKGNYSRIVWCLNFCSLAFLTVAGLGFNGYAQQLIMGIFVGFGLCAIVLSRLKSDRVLPVVIIIALVLVATLPGLWQVTSFCDQLPIVVLQIQQHYAMCVGFADKLSLGVPLGSETLLYYGVLIPTALGAFQRLVGPLSFGALTHLVQITQLILLGCVGALVLGLARRTKELGLIAFFTVLPWFHFNQAGLCYPNQSGWRYLGVFLSLILVLKMRRLSPSLLPFALGGLAGFCLLYNVETGLTMLVATSVSLFLLRAKFSQKGNLILLKVPLLYLSALAASFAIYVVLFFLLFGYYPSFLNPSKITIYIRAVEAISMSGPILPVAIFVFLHSSYIFARVITLEPSSVTIRHAFRAVVAVLIIVWELYYFNRPFFTNLAGSFALYSLLLVDSLRFVRIALLRRGQWHSESLVLLGALLVIVFPTTLLAWEEGLKSYTRAISIPSRKTESRLVSDVLLPRAMGDSILEKSAYLKELSKSATFRFVSIYSLLIPKVSQLEQPFPYTDPFFGINSGHDYFKYVLALKNSGATYILLDDLASDPVLEKQGWYSLYLSSLAQILSERYECTGMAHGWQIWMLRKAKT